MNAELAGQRLANSRVPFNGGRRPRALNALIAQALEEHFCRGRQIESAVHESRAVRPWAGLYATLVARLAALTGRAGAQLGEHSAPLLPQQFSVK